MEQYGNEIFGFSNESNEELEQTNNFNYDSISGLGESNYENEDLFNTEVEDNNINDFRIGGFENPSTGYDLEDNLISNVEEFKLEEDSKENDFEMEEVVDNSEELFRIFSPIGMEEENYVPEVDPVLTENFPNPVEPAVEFKEVAPVLDTPQVEEDDFNVEQSLIENFPNPLEETLETQEIEDEPVITENDFKEVEPLVEEYIEPVVEIKEEEPTQKIEMSQTPIEELNNLTLYKEEKIEETDINSLFDRVSVNFKDASDIFRKNTDLKQKIDTRFEELKKLQSELENSRKKQLDEINNYKEEVLTKLTEKKEEIERRLNLLKDSQATLEKEKQEFEVYKKKEQENIDKVQKEVQSAYDDRREELNHIEDVLRKQKDALDEERSQLSLDRIEYEADKNELANNLLKFNELVNSFTNGMNDIKE